MEEKHPSLPGYRPPTVAERLRFEASLPFSARKLRAVRSRPIAVGLFDEDGRHQLDLIDAIRAEQAHAQGDAE